MRTFLLVPSPLLGPATWRPVAGALSARGEAVRVVRFPSDVRDAAGVVAGVVAAVVAAVAAAAERPGDGGEIVLVPHSNAGLVAPRVAELVGVRATVYVDAALPAAVGPDTALAPPAFLDFLTGLAVDGVLPPWTHWWEDLGRLFPSAASRAAVEAEQPRLPLTYFTSRLPVPTGWTAHRQAYLAFGTTYAEEVDLARSSGWPVRVVEGTHLHALHDPAGVADAILELTASCA